MAIIEFEADTLCVDATLLGESLGVEPSLVQVLMRPGKITSFCERGIDGDAGRYRLTFFMKIGASCSPHRGGWGASSYSSERLERRQRNLSSIQLLSFSRKVSPAIFVRASGGGNTFRNEFMARGRHNRGTADGRLSA